MTFDLVGLNPGAPLKFPVVNHRVHLPDDFLRAHAKRLACCPRAAYQRRREQFRDCAGLAGRGCEGRG
jgi:hypothetical protein